MVKVKESRIFCYNKKSDYGKLDYRKWDSRKLDSRLLASKCYSMKSTRTILHQPLGC